MEIQNAKVVTVAFFITPRIRKTQLRFPHGESIIVHLSIKNILKSH